MSAVPYTQTTAPYRAYRNRSKPICDRLPESAPPLETVLSLSAEDEALQLLRDGQDTRSIAWQLECTEAAAYNGIARARDRERAQ